MAEAILRHRLDALEVDIEVASAGFTLHDQPADRKARKAMDRRGIDIDHHRSQLVDPELIDEALIVITMARKHVREILDLSDDSYAKTFTLKELVHRAKTVGAVGDDESAPDWIARVHEGRERSLQLGAGADTDIDDPIGRSTRFFQTTATEIDNLVVSLIDFWWPELASESPSQVAGP